MCLNCSFSECLAETIKTEGTAVFRVVGQLLEERMRTEKTCARTEIERGGGQRL